MINEKYFKRISNANFEHQEALESHISVELIQETCLIHLEGAPPVAYYSEKHSLSSSIIQAVNKIKYNASTRSANKGENSILFGAVNKKISKMGFCTQGALISRNKGLNEFLCTVFASLLNSLMRRHLLPRHKIGAIKLGQKMILPDYLMGKTNFTSGIINRNSAFKYHRDGFNMSNTYSSMIVYKKDVSGGYLVFPEYGIGFKLDDQSIIQFYGKGILHGVTPIVKHDAEAYRISIVYYVSEDLDKCSPYIQELEYARNLKS